MTVPAPIATWAAAVRLAQGAWAWQVLSVLQLPAFLLLLLQQAVGRLLWWLSAFPALIFPPSPAPIHSAHLSIAPSPWALSPVSPSLREAVARGGEV